MDYLTKIKKENLEKISPNNLLLENAGRDDGTIADILLAAVYSGRPDLFELGENLSFLDLLEQFIIQDPFHPYPKPEEIAGQFKIGHALPKTHEYGLTPEQILRNVEILGSVGTGKTTTINKILENLYLNGIPFLIISVAKKDFRGLIRLFPDIQVISGRDFRLNLLESTQWTLPVRTINDFVDIYAHGADVMLRSKSMIARTLFELFSTFGENESQQPCLEDLLDILKSKSVIPGLKRDDFIQRNIERIEAFLLLSENIFRCSSGFSIEKLLEYPVILELEGLSDTIINFIMISLLTKILRYRLEKGDRGKLRHVLIFDEAKRIFSNAQEKNYQMGIPPIDYLVSYARELGEGIIAADQEATKLTDTLHACTNTKIAFQVSGKEIREVARVFGLNEQQIDVLRHLPTGTAIVKDEKSPHLFLAQMDNIEIPKGIHDQEVKEHSRGFIELLNRDVNPRSTILITCKKKEERKPLTKQEEVFLINISKKSELTVTEHYTANRFSRHTGDKLLKILSNKGFIKKVIVQTGMRGRQPVILEITDKGKDYLQKSGIKVTTKGKGGVVHRWWQRKIKEYYEKRGCAAEIEPNHGGMNTDVLVTDSTGTRTAIEVALSFKGQVHNIQRDLEHFDKVIMTAPSKSLLERIEEESKKLLSAKEINRVSFSLLQNYLEKSNG